MPPSTTRRSTPTTITTKPPMRTPVTLTRQWRSAPCSGPRSTARQRLLVGGKLNKFIPNPVFDPVAKPGSLDEYFRGKNPKAQDIRSLFGDLEPIRPEYRDRDARLSVMDRQGLDGCFLFPTLGVGMEEALADDPPALVAAFEAFNRWLEDDWGYAYKERIFAAPMITLIDVDAAVAELTARPRRGRPDRLHKGWTRVHAYRSHLPGRHPIRPLLGPGQRVRCHGRDPFG